MDLSNRNLLQDLTFSPPPSPIIHRATSTGTSFPILAVAVIGILATTFLLVSYYVFVIKCCLNWHRIDILRRFSLSRNRRHNLNPLMVYSPETRNNNGLDESVIRAIPIFKFKKRVDEGDRYDDVLKGEGEEKSSQECSVCLNEFQDEEKLRIIPNCSHFFHIDCIDVWLQNNTNCPLCRARVSCDTSFPPDWVSCDTSFTPDFVSAPSSSPENATENEFVVIELVNTSCNDGDSHERLLLKQERSNSGHLVTENSRSLVSPSPRKLENGGLERKYRKVQKMTSMGDECIDIRRDKDEQFGNIQPFRRSISMDSSADRQLYLAVQEAIRKNREVPVVGDGGGCSSSSSGNVGNYRVKRCFFSFGSSRCSRSSSILPLSFEP